MVPSRRSDSVPVPSGGVPSGLRRLLHRGSLGQRVADLSEDRYYRSSLNPPSWRGRMHAAMVPTSLAGGIWLVVVAPGAGYRAVIALYAAGLVGMFTVSAAFHLRRRDRDGWERMRRWDHLAIYALIAGSYGAIMGLGVPGWPRTWLLGAGLGLCAAGMVHRCCVDRPPNGVMTTLFLLSGGVSMFGIRQILEGLGTVGTIVVLVGCAFYGLGAVALGLQRPNPWPGHFEYHEVWHLNVIMASGCQFWVVAYVVVPSL